MLTTDLLMKTYAQIDDAFAKPAPPAEPDWRARVRTAADLIEQRGHCKNVVTKDGALCILGALTVAHGYEPIGLNGIRNEVGTTRYALEGALRSDACLFNNTHTAAEVVQALRTAAAG